MQVDLTGIAATLATLIFGVATRVVYALIEAHIKNATMRDVLESALGNALGKMQQATQAEIAQSADLHPTISNPLIAVGVRYAISHASEAIDHFGLAPDALADKIEARLGVAQIKTNLAVAGSSLPATPAPLDPLPIFPAGSVSTAELNTAEAQAQGAR